MKCENSNIVNHVIKDETLLLLQESLFHFFEGRHKAKCDHCAAVRI